MCLGIPGQILEIGDSASHLAKVNLSGTPRTVDISLVDEEGATVGEWVLVHAGFALSKISETEARDILELFREMSELNAEDERARATGNRECSLNPTGSGAPRYTKRALPHTDSRAQRRGSQRGDG